MLFVVDSKNIAVLGHEGVDETQHGVALALLLVLAQGVRVAEQRFEDADNAVIVPLAQLLEGQQSLCT